MTTTRRRKKKRKTGNKLVGLFLLVTTFLLCFPVLAKDKVKKTETYSVVAGTIFRPPGFVLPGVEVTLKPEKGKVQRAVSNTRGEFAFRVPPVFARYTIGVKANGFQSEEKTTEVGIEQRIDLAFELKPNGKP